MGMDMFAAETVLELKYVTLMHHTMDVFVRLNLLKVQISG